MSEAGQSKGEKAASVSGRPIRRRGNNPSLQAYFSTMNPMAKRIVTEKHGSDVKAKANLVDSSNKENKTAEEKIPVQVTGKNESKNENSDELQPAVMTIPKFRRPRGTGGSAGGPSVRPRIKIKTRSSTVGPPATKPKPSTDARPPATVNHVSKEDQVNSAVEKGKKQEEERVTVQDKEPKKEKEVVEENVKATEEDEGNIKTPSEKGPAVEKIIQEDNNVIENEKPIVKKKTPPAVAAKPASRENSEVKHQLVKEEATLEVSSQNETEHQASTGKEKGLSRMDKNITMTSWCDGNEQQAVSPTAGRKQESSAGDVCSPKSPMCKSFSCVELSNPEKMTQQVEETFKVPISTTNGVKKSQNTSSTPVFKKPNKPISRVFGSIKKKGSKFMGSLVSPRKEGKMEKETKANIPAYAKAPKSQASSAQYATTSARRLPSFTTEADPSKKTLPHSKSSSNIPNYVPPKYNTLKNINLSMNVQSKASTRPSLAKTVESMSEAKRSPSTPTRRATVTSGEYNKADIDSLRQKAALLKSSSHPTEATVKNENVGDSSTSGATLKVVAKKTFKPVAAVKAKPEPLEVERKEDGSVNWSFLTEW
eukprot:Nk52_evm113s226 gene=Nk52_evmTU113s226